MTLQKSKEDFKKKLIKFIEYQKDNKLDTLKSILEDNENCTGDYPTKPKNVSIDNISAKGERAFQRAILNGEYSLLNYQEKTDIKKVVWLDLELPVTFNKNSRRRSIDLIGSLNDIPVLCELKYYENSQTDSPIYAILELLMYHYLIQCNYKKLDKYNVHHAFPMKKFKWYTIVENENSQLLIVANKKYWDFWFKKISKEELLKNTFSLGRVLNANIHLFETQDEDYIEQKGKQTTYKPTVSSNNWTEINV